MEVGMAADGETRALDMVADGVLIRDTVLPPGVLTHLPDMVVDTEVVMVRRMVDMEQLPEVMQAMEAAVWAEERCAAHPVVAAVWAEDEVLPVDVGVELPTRRRVLSIC